MNNFKVLHLKRLFDSIVVQLSQFSGITLTPGVLVLVDLGLIDFLQESQVIYPLTGSVGQDFSPGLEALISWYRRGKRAPIIFGW